MRSSSVLLLFIYYNNNKDQENGVDKFMQQSIEALYREMMESGGSLEESLSSPARGMAYPSGSFEDDGEEFLTSKELLQEKKRMEEILGGKRPGRGPRGGEPGIEEEMHFKRYTKRREHKYTESEKQQIRESCMATIVHDYAEHDIYHQSDEERAEHDVLSSIRMKLATLKRTYRKVDQYIEAMRTVMEAWRILEKNNYIHTTEEFFELVAQGRIYSSSIIMPKLKKVDNYNMDVIIQYISNPDVDPKDLVPEVEEAPDPFYDSWSITKDPQYEKYYDEFTESLTDDQKDEMDASDIHIKAHEYAVAKIQEETAMRLLSPEEAQWLSDHQDDIPEFKVKDLKRKWIKNYDRRTFGRSKKKKKKESKTDKLIRENVHTILNKIQANVAFNQGAEYNRSYLVTQSMFDVEKPGKDFWEDLRFTGSWASDEDVFLYDLVVREELLKQHPVNQRYFTYGDQELANFFNVLEKHGVNVVDLRRQMNIGGEGTITDAATTAAKRKENKKLESAILQRITKLNGDPSFKKLATKAENALNKRFEEG